MLAAEELYLRSTTHQRADAPPAPRRPSPAAVIPREERMPGPGSARRAVRPTRPAGAGGPDAELKKYAAFQKQLHPEWDDEDRFMVYGAHNPSGASVRSLLFFAQNIKMNRFQ